MQDNITNLIDSWGLYPFFSTEKRDDTVHADDYAAFVALSPYGKVFHSIGIEGGYLILAYGKAHFRVNPERYRIVPKPLFEIDEMVTDTRHPDWSTVIEDIHWHWNKKEHNFYLRVAGKKRSKRYYTNDLEKRFASPDE